MQTRLKLGHIYATNWAQQRYYVGILYYNFQADVRGGTRPILAEANVVAA
jgi:hypothetical protein